MSNRRRMMQEDDVDQWQSNYGDDDDGGSEGSTFNSRETSFDNNKRDTSNPHISRAQEDRGNSPVEGPVKWKMVDGHPVPVSEGGDSGAVPGASPSLRKTLVAVQGPKGVLVARAIRDTVTGSVKHLEPMRLPTQSELNSVQQQGVVVPAPKGLSSVESAVGGTSNIKKVALGVGVAGVIGFLVWKATRD